MPQDWHNPIFGGCRHDTYTRLRGVFEALSPCLLLLPSFHHLHIFLPGRLCPGFLSLSTPGLHHSHQGSLVHQLPPTRPSALHHRAALASAGLAWYYKKAAGSLLPTPASPLGLLSRAPPPRLRAIRLWLAATALSPHPLDSGQSASLTSLRSSRSLHPQAAAQAVPSASHTLLPPPSAN